MRLNADIDWLLGEDNPSVAYRTRREILGEPADTVAELYGRVLERPAVVKILDKLNSDGLWDSSEYGVHTSLRYLGALAELGVKWQPRLDRAVEYALDDRGAKPGEYTGCADGLTLRAIVMLGYADEARERAEAFARQQLSDGGYCCTRLLEKKPSRRSCYKAAVAGMLLHAEYARLKKPLPGWERIVEYFTRREVFLTSDLSRPVIDGRAGWRFCDSFFPAEPMRIGLPLILSSLAALGAGGHVSMGRTWDMALYRSSSEGRWVLEGTLTKQPCSFGKVGQPNKWVTFYMALADVLAARQGLV